MKNVLIVSKSFPPIRHGGTIRVEAFCRNLPKFTIEPTVLTSSTSKVDESRRQDYLLDSETDNKTRVIRIPWNTNGEGQALPRGLSKLPLHESYRRYLSRRNTVNTVNEQLNQLESSITFDAVLTTVPPGDSAVLANDLAQKLGIPLLVDLRDPWSYWPMPLYTHYLDFLLERSVESKILRRAAHVIVTTEASKLLLKRKFRLKENSISVIPNGYNESDFHGISDKSRTKSDEFLITHTGTLNDPLCKSRKQRFLRHLGFYYDPLNTNYSSRSAIFILRAIADLVRNEPELQSQLKIMLVGTSRDHLKRTLKEFPYPDMIDVRGRVSEQEATQIAWDSNLLLLPQLETYLDGDEFCVAIPGKLYSYLRTGNRTLVCAQESENTRLVSNLGMGRAAHPRDVTEIANAIRSEYSLWKEGKAKRIVSEEIHQFERSNQAEQLSRLIHHVCSA